MDIQKHPSQQAVKSLLSEAGLPASDIAPGLLGHFFACGSREAPMGVVGLELYGEVALLRSLAVRPAHRRGGLGSALVAHAERHARAQGVGRLYLSPPRPSAFYH